MTGTDDDFSLDDYQTSQQDDQRSDIDRLIDQTESDDDRSQSSEQGTKEQTSQDDRGGQDQAASGPQDPGRQPPGHDQGQRGPQDQGQGTSGAQDLTLKDGSIIKGGGTRRIYERGLQNERLAPQLNQLQQERDQFRSQVQAYENAFQTAKQSGLNPQESAWAHKIVSAFKQDPVKTLNYLLTQVKTAGYDTSQFGQGVDANALRQMLAQEIGPIKQNFEQEQRQRQIQQEGEQAYNTFLQQFPEATKHEDEIAQLMENGLEPQAAYYALRSAYLERGLDFNLSLQENAQRRATNGGAQSRQPIPHGRGNVVQNAPAAHNSPMASENDSWDNIIRTVMS